MPEDIKPGCQRPAIKKPLPQEDSSPAPIPCKGVETAMIQVGKPAPDFTAPAFYQGKFTKKSLSEFLGKWILLCFYPGDFTFV